jgi:hypothetical protein
VIDPSAFGEVVQSSPFGVWAGGEAYPIANLVHILGLIMLVGGIGVLDLRLIGLFRKIPTAALAAALTPIAIAGLLLMVPSGATMFASDASTLVNSGTFRTKLLLIALALANAVAFRFIWQGRIEQWDFDLPFGGRVMAAASILLWLSIAALGRWIAYS